MAPWYWNRGMSFFFSSDFTIDVDSQDSLSHWGDAWPAPVDRNADVPSLADLPSLGYSTSYYSTSYASASYFNYGNYPDSTSRDEAMARTSQWVEDHSAQDQAPISEPEPEPAPESQNTPAQPTTPPPRDIMEEAGNTNDVSLPPGRVSPEALPKAKYDIAALLELRYTHRAVPILLHVNSEAIAGKYLETVLAFVSKDTMC